MENIGERLLRLRKEKGLTQEEVGARLSLSPQSVSKWENGTSLPEIDTLGKLADLYGVSTDYLLGRDDAKERRSSSPTIVIHVEEGGKEEVNISLPYSLAKMFLRKGMHLGTEKTDGILSAEQLDEAVASGARGKIVEVKDEDANVTIAIE